MMDFPEFGGAMADWPKVEALPGATRVLAALKPDWMIALATNAQNSSAEQIRRALERVGLSDDIEKIYCYRTIGYRKPQKEYFAHILADLGLPARGVVMVGDDLEADVLGARRCGMQAIWLASAHISQRGGEGFHIIYSLEQLPGVLKGLRITIDGHLT